MPVKSVALGQRAVGENVLVGTPCVAASLTTFADVMEHFRFDPELWHYGKSSASEEAVPTIVWLAMSRGLVVGTGNQSPRESHRATVDCG